jgi:D-alanine-D-alanine ligase
MKTIAVFFGGQSSEHEVSCKSVLNVLENLDEKKYETQIIGITKEGKWLYVPSAEKVKDESWRQGTVSALLSPDTSHHGILLCEDGTYRLKKVDVLYPVLHGLYGEDGSIQGLFELSGIPYVGSGVLSSSVCMDKITTKIFVEQLGICQARFVTDVRNDLKEIDKTVSEAENTLGYPVFVKPSNAGSSRGVSKANNRAELKRAIEVAKKHDNRVLIEEAIVGREIECAVLGGWKPEAAGPGEIIAAAEFYDYDAKYNNEDSLTIINPDIPEDIKENVRESAIKIYQHVNAYSQSRVDFFLENDTNRLIFNEINTLPGFTNISMYSKLWMEKGYDMTMLLDKIIETAGERYGTAGNRKYKGDSI